MAVKTPLRHVAQRIGNSIRSFGVGEGWREDEFIIAGTLDEQTDRIYLVVGSLRPLDERRWHLGIMNAIRKVFPDTSRIVLVVRHVTGIEEVFHEMVTGDNEIDITEMF